MKRIVFSIALLGLLLTSKGNFSSAQCAMCKASAESSLKEGNKTAAGLNTGILYLLVMPYLLVGGIGYYWYITNKKKSVQDEEL